MTGGIRQQTADGVPVLCAGAPSGRTTAALVFRVGRVNETLPSAGITHLIEHLALAGHHDAPYEFNAEVSGRFTTFFMTSADPAHVSGFVTAVCQGLARDARAMLDQEKRILRAEAATRGSRGAHASCLVERFGAAGPGLLGHEEFGLHRLTWAEIEAWRAHWFVTGNAVLWVAGTVPADLRISLPWGPPPPPATARQRPLGLPGFVTGGRGGVGISMSGPRSWDSSAALDVLQRRLNRVLRHERGLSYGVQASAEPCDAELVDAWLAADALPDEISVAAHTALAVIEDVADHGCEPAELADHRRRIRDRFTSPEAVPAMLQRQATNILDRRPTREADEDLEAIERITPAAVARTTADLLSRAIVVTPAPVPAIQGRMPRLPAWSSETITGTSWPSHDQATQLTVGDDGVMLTMGRDQQATVRFDSVAAVLRWADGQRALVGLDGFVVRLDPAAWPGSAQAFASIESRVDPRLTVDLDGPGPAQQAPAQQAPAQQAHLRRVPVPAPAPRAATRPDWGSRILWVVIFAALLFGELGWLGGERGSWGLIAVSAGGLAWRSAPILYRRLRPSASPGVRHGWLFRILRGVIVTLTVIATIAMTGGDPASWPLVVTGLTALAGQAGLARLLST